MSIVQLAPTRCGLFGAHPSQEQEMTVLTKAHYEEGMQQFREKLKELGDEILREVSAQIDSGKFAGKPSAPLKSTPTAYNQMSQAEAVQLVDWAVEYGADLETYAEQGISFERFANLRWNEENGVSMVGAHKFDAPMLAAIRKRDGQFAAKCRTQLASK